MAISHIILHHSAVSRTKNSNQFEAINNYHIGRGWWQIGYHWLIEPNGDIKQGRVEWTPWAHCKEASMNYKSIGVCFSWHFDEEEPTKEQYEALNKLVKWITKRWGELIIEPHNKYATYKTCPWKNFKLNIMTDLEEQNLDALISLVSASWHNLKGIEWVQGNLEKFNSYLRWVKTWKQD
jgi:N-acetylmuramoyl-L-alanine amidase